MINMICSAPANLPSNIICNCSLLQGFGYAGLQYASQCFCGDEYDKYGRFNNCNMKCAGNENEMCGGAWANQIYRIGK